MIFTADKLKEARDAGYSDDEIWSHVSSIDNRFNAAKSEGYSLDEVATYFSSQKPADTSIGQEISQIPAALKQSFGQPLEAMGETAQVAGFPAVATALKGAIQEPEGYVSAGERFMAPKEGEFQIAGFAPQYAPRAVVEQTGQLIGSIGSRLAGAVTLGGLGGLIGGVGGAAAGAAAGAFAGPALFEAAQIVGPVALERAKNNGYTEPTDKDMAYAIATAAGSGLLNAFGAKYLPGGEKAVGSFAKRLAASFIGEGIPEGLQSFTQQVGETIETEKGIQVSPKQAIGEALIGGGAGAAATTIAAPFTPEQIAEAKINESANKEAENLFIGNDNPQGKAVLSNKQKLEQEIADAKQVLQAIESTDPIAQKLKLELKEKEAILAAAQGQVDSIIESADPVAEAERQQAELAKAIAEEPATRPLPTDALPTETPGATYGREEQKYDIFGGIRRKPMAISKPAELPAAPTIEEQTSEGTYGGQTGVFDVFAGARRKPVKVAPTITEAAPVAEEIATMASEIVPQEVLEAFSENQPLMERIRKDALEKKGGSLQTYTTASVRTKGVPKSQIQSITNKVLKQFEESATLAEIEEAVTNEVEKISSIKEKKKSDDAKLKSALQRTGETYELDTAIQDYKNKLIELERAQKSILSTPALRQMERVGAKNNLEKSKQNLIAIAAKSAPVTEQAEAPAPEVAPAKPLTDEQAETIRDMIALRKSQGREANPELVKRLAEYDAKKAGVEVQTGDIVSNIVVGHPMFESPQPELNNLVPIKVTTKEQLASRFTRVQQIRDTAQSYISNYQVEQAKAKTPAQKKAFAKKFRPSELQRQRDILDYIKNDVMPELDRLEKLAPSASEVTTQPKEVASMVTSATPAVSETEPTLPKLKREKADTDFASIDEITDIIHESSPKGTDKSESKRIATNLVKDYINQTIDWVRDTFGSAPEKVGFDATEMKKWLKDAVSIRPVTEDEFTKGIIKKKGSLTTTGEDRGKINVSVLSPLESRLIALHEASHFLYHLDDTKTIPENVLKSIKNKKLMPDRFPNPSRNIKEKFADAFTNWAFTKMHPEYANEFPPVPQEFVSWIESEAISEPLDSISSVNKIKNQKRKLTEKTATPAVSATITEPAAAPAGIAVGNRIRLGKSPQTYTIEEVIPQSEAEKELGEQYYSVKNEKTGETQVVEKNDIKPVSGKKRKMAARPNPLPENERYGQVKLNRRVQSYFGGKIPDRVYVVDDAVDPEYEYKAAYYPDEGILILNNAFIRKGENIGDIIAHELGHYAFGDAKFKAAFDEFYNSLTPEEKADIDQLMGDSYNNETEESQMEERKVIAFTSFTIATPQRRSLWNAVLDAMKAFFNRVFGKNYKMSDPTRTALAMLATAKRRFAAGEEIVREDTKAKRAAAQTQDARFAELEARARAGDKEAEAEAQRMVDEAAKEAGYNRTYYHGTDAISAADIKANGVDQSKSEKGYFGRGFYMAEDKNLAKENYADFSGDKSGGEVISLSFPDSSNILDLRTSEGFDIYKKLTYKNRSVESLLGDDNFNKIMTSLGVDGLIDESFGGIVVYNEDILKSADPFTYDDAGNLIPLSERFQPTTPDIRRMAVEAEPRREKGQVASIKNAGAEKKTPKQIIARTRELLRKDFFNPAEVTEQNTLTAFRALGKLVGPKKQAAAYAEELNDIGRLVDEEGVASEVSMGAILFTNDLFEYSIKLAAEGQKMMLGIMMSNMNKLPLGEGLSLEESARSMRGALERSTRFTMMGKAEQDAYTNYVAEFIYGPNPTKEQIQSIKDAYAKVDKTEPITEEELTDELEEVGKRTGTDLVGKINIQIEEATPPTQNPIVSTILILQKLYGGTIETRYLKARESAQKIKEGVKKILTGGITNYRGKMIEGAASGLESGFWKTLANTENKPGPLGELDNAQNRELGSIVKSMLISLGLKGTPPNTKMDIYEQVASILGEKPLSNDKIKLADEKIRDEINRKREKELSETEDQDAQDAINLKYNGIENAWDQSMARQLDIPISDAMLRRLIFNELKEEKTSITDLAKLMNEEPVIGASRQDRLVNSIISKIAGVTFEGQNPADYSALKEYLGNQLEALIIEKQTKGKAARAKEQLAKDAKGSVELQAEKAENEAQKQIERLAKIQSDTPSFPGEAQMNPVREAVKNALKLNLNRMFDPSQSAEIISNFKKSFVKELMELGVKEQPATILADVVGRQIEINSLNNQLKSIDRAIEKGPISEIVKAIKDTPLEDQQNPNWRYEVMRDYLRRAGLNVAQSERIAKLMDISLQKRFTMAQEQAFTDAISKTAPWKSGDTRSRRAFQKVLQALRAGALDPARNVLSDMAALNGWTGFTPDQYKTLLKNDAIISNPESADATKAEAHKAIQDIISKAKLPIRARDVMGQYYDAQALSGIQTMTVNIFSPAGMAAKNALTQALNGVITARPEQIGAALTTFADSIKSWANTVAFSFKNNVTVYSNVEYLVNDEGLLKLYKKGVDQFTNGKTSRDRADGVKNMMIGMMDYVRRVLNALDYGAIASLQNQSVSKYALAAMQAKGMSSKDGAKMLNAMMEQKRIFYNDQVAIGTDKNKAAVLADEFFVSAWRQALTDAKLPAQEVMDAALNDAMSAVGRNRQSLDAFREEETNIRDEGLLSFPAIWLLETMANAANRQDNQFIKIFSRVIYGFAIVPARVLRETAWFSPVGAYRFAYDAIAKKMGLKNRYAQSLGNDLQYRQRLTETITGSLVMLAFAAAMSASTDDEDDEKPFKIVATGNGPLRSEDPQFYDSWMKKNRPNTVSVYFGKTKFTLNTMRGFEAFAWPAMMLGAVDDWHIRRKQKRTTNTPLQMQDAAIVAGNVLSASLRRGPYAFAAKPLFEAYGDRGVESLAKSLAFPAKTIIPVLGSSLASNISNFLNEPVDRRTLEGALWANIPFIGPAVAPKSLNAFGEPAMANDAADKIFKLGVPIVFDIPNDRNSIMVHELVLKQGGGPSIPNRSQLAKRLDREPTNKEFEMFVREYGAEIKRVMTENIEELSAMSGPEYDRAMEYIGNNARDAAQVKLMESK